MLLLPALSLVTAGLFTTGLFLLPSGRPGSLFGGCGSSWLFLLLRAAGTVIQPELDSMADTLLWLCPGVVNLAGLLMYAWPALSLDLCSLGHEFTHAEWGPLQLVQRLGLPLSLAGHWSSEWPLLAQYLHL